LEYLQGRALRRPRHKWEDITMCLREVGWECVNWMHLAQDRNHCPFLVKMAMNFQIP